MIPPAIATAETPAAIAGGLRLNLGGRDTSIAGFRNVDLKPGPTVDYVSDISNLSIFRSGSVDEIYASHCLEHFPHTRTLGVLTEWRRVLKPGASAHISVPDFDAAVQIYVTEGLVDFLRNLLWGDQGYDLAFHYTGFTFATLAALLVRAGFGDVKRRKWMPYGVNDCSSLVDNVRKQPISLTVEAFA